MDDEIVIGIEKHGTFQAICGRFGRIKPNVGV